MAAFKLNFSLDQGATNRKLLTWKTGTPPTEVNLSGCSARLQARPSIKSDTVLIELGTFNNTIILGSQGAGTIELIFYPESTIGSNWTTAFYDLEITLANGDIKRLVEGTLTLSPEVTRE